MHCVGLTLLDETGASTLVTDVSLVDEAATITHDALLDAATASRNRLVMVGDGFTTAAAPGEVVTPAMPLPPSAPIDIVTEAGDQSVIISWSPASPEANPATSFTVTMCEQTGHFKALGECSVTCKKLKMHSHQPLVTFSRPPPGHSDPPTMSHCQSLAFRT